MTRDIQIMWLVEKLETVQVHYELDSEGLGDQKCSNEWEGYMVYYMAPSGLLTCLYRFCLIFKWYSNDWWYTNYVVGGKIGDGSGSLRTRLWRPRGPEIFEWMRNLRGVLHGTKWIAYMSLHVLLSIALGLSKRVWFNVKNQGPWRYIRLSRASRNIISSW